MSTSYEELRRMLDDKAVEAEEQRQPEVEFNQLQQALREQAREVEAGERVMVPIEEEEPQGAGRDAFQRIGARFTGSDVSDPRELERLTNVAVGGLAGGMMGSRVPTRNQFVNPITGAAAGSLVGTAVGAVAPELTVKALEKAQVLPEGTSRETTLTVEELQTVVTGEVLLDLATFGTFQGARLAGRQITGAMTGLTKESRRVADASAELGIDLMPVQAGDGALGRGFVTVMGKFPLVGRPLVKKGEEAEKAFSRILDEAPGRALNTTERSTAELLSRSGIGEAIYRDARNTVGEINRHFHEAYEAVYDAAAASGVRVVPRHTVDKGEELFRRLHSDAPRKIDPDAVGGLSSQELRGVEKIVSDFLEEAVLPLKGVIDGSPAIATNTLRQMDNLIGKVDQQLASLEPGQKRYGQSLLLQLRQSMKMDVLTNTRGEGAEEIIQQLRQLDNEFGQTMQQVVKTTAAKKVGAARRRGLRAIELDEATATPVDKLGQMLIRSQSPQIARELRSLVTPETYNRIAASALDDAIQGSMRQTPDGTFRFSSEAFEKGLGVDRVGSMRGAFMEELLRDSAGYSARDMENLVMAGRAIAGLEIPNASQFVARRAVLGGVTALAGAFAIGHTANNKEGGVLGVLAFLGGSRLVARALANPDTARSLRTVMDKEARRTVRKQAGFDTIRGALELLGEDDELPAPRDQMWELGRQYWMGVGAAAEGESAEPSRRDMIQSSRRLQEAQSDMRGVRSARPDEQTGR